MIEQQQAASGQPEKRGAVPPAAPGRRRFLLAGAATAPILMTLASRPALANSCSISGMQSGNLSRDGEEVDCAGLTPGYWKNHPNVWPDYVPGPKNPLSGKKDKGGVGGGNKDYSVPTDEELLAAVAEGKLTQGQYIAYKAAPPGTLFAAVFGPGLITDEDVTLMQCLQLDGGMSPGPVLAHVVAALLNSIYFGAERYGMSREQVIAYVQANLTLDPIGTKDALQMLNERGA